MDPSSAARPFQGTPSRAHCAPAPTASTRHALRAAAGSLMALVALAALMTGCGSSPTIPPTRAELEQQIESRGVSEEVVLPFELDEEMKRWVLQSVPEFGNEEERMNFLLTGLLSERRLGIRYQDGYTGTAQEVFESRRANCLSFTQLFVGMAREAGIPAYYVRVGDIQGYERAGDLVVVSGHVTAGYGDPLDQEILEFNLGPEVNYKVAEPISDLTGIAMYYSNRAAELIQEERLEEAMVAAETALDLDPELAIAWVNRGVGLRRQDRWEQAEASYRKAIDLEPDLVTAWLDLEAVLRLQGRTEEAVQVAEKVEKLGSRNPYTLISRGDKRLALGEADAARILYRRALRLLDDKAEAYASVGFAELVMENLAEAALWLRRAQAVDAEQPRVKTLERRLASGEGLTHREFARLIVSHAVTVSSPGSDAEEAAGSPSEVVPASASPLPETSDRRGEPRGRDTDADPDER